MYLPGSKKSAISTESDSLAERCLATALQLPAVAATESCLTNMPC